MPAWPPPRVLECVLGALVPDPALREAVLGDMAEEFAERCADQDPVQARRWYRGQAIRSVPHLLAACWWPAPAMRERRFRALLGGVVGGYLILLLLHQAAQQVGGVLLTRGGHGIGGWAGVTSSLGAGVTCALFGGYVAARALPAAPLAPALGLAGVCVALAVAGIAINGGATPLWYWVGLQLLLFPLGACAGGVLRAARRQA